MAVDDLLAWDTPRVTFEEKVARIRANPHYGDAARAFASAKLAQAEADPALDGILKDAGRNIAGKCLAYLHVTGGVTLPRLKALCAQIGMLSLGRARALLFYLRYLGYAEPAPRRMRGPRRYAPTAKFTQTWRRHMCAMLECAAVVEPEVAKVSEHLDPGEVYEAFVRSISECYLEGRAYVDEKSPFFRVFMHRYAGTQIVHSLIVESPEIFPPQQPIAFSAALTAKRFGVSRVHVLRMFNSAQENGLVSFAADGAVTFEPPGREAVDHIYAIQLVIFLVSAARTLKARPLLLESSEAA